MNNHTEEKSPHGNAMAQYGDGAMKRGQIWHVDGNKRYHHLGSWLSKTVADGWAKELRKVGYLARVLPRDGNKRFNVVVAREDGREYNRIFTEGGSIYRLESKKNATMSSGKTGHYSGVVFAKNEAEGVKTAHRTLGIESKDKVRLECVRVDSDNMRTYRVITYK